MGDEHLGVKVPMLAGGVLQKCTETHRGRGGVKIGEYWDYALFEWLRVRTGKQMGKMCKSIAVCLATLKCHKTYPTRIH